MYRSFPHRIHPRYPVTQFYLVTLPSFNCQLGPKVPPSMRNAPQAPLGGTSSPRNVLHSIPSIANVTVGRYLDASYGQADDSIAFFNMAKLSLHLRSVVSSQTNHLKVSSCHVGVVGIGVLSMSAMERCISRASFALNQPRIPLSVSDNVKSIHTSFEPLSDTSAVR